MSARTPNSAGYSKGDATRAKILTAALKTFGSKGFKGTTTRDIADQSEVSLPALKYYFGNKEGLYLAGASEIVDLYVGQFAPMESLIRGQLETGMSSETARTLLKELMKGLVDFLLGSDESENWRLFVLREMSDPGPAFEILYEHIWSKGIDLCAALVGCVIGEPAGSSVSRIQALLLISHVAAFEPGRAVALRTLGWPDVRGERLELLKDVLGRQIDRIG